jgi:hypothetical protein
MPRYKVLARSKGSVEVLKTFGKREDAESFVRLTQRNPKYGSLMIEEEKTAPPPSAAGPQAAQSAAKATAAPAKGMPYWLLGLIALGILAAAIVGIEVINTALSGL